MTLVVAALFGLAFGSFANAAIDRTRTNRSLLGRSGCDGCARELAAWELVPVLSYLLLRGRCSTCGARIGARTPFVEAACGALFATSFALLPAPLAFASSAASIGIVLTVAFAERRRIAA
jgi:prepilin signal peptidase PulO-like enzyme (type II secretory pathway)